MSEPNESDQVPKRLKPNDLIIAQPPLDALRSRPLSPRLFDLNIHGFYEVFDWLSLKELLTVSRMCDFMQQVAGDFFICNYGGADVTYSDGMFMTGEPPLQINGFEKFIRKIIIYDNVDAPFKLIASKCQALKQIRFTNVTLTPSQVEIIKQALNRIESIQMICVDVSDRFRPSFLKHCSSLKSLSLRNFNQKSVSIGTGNEWLHHSYPTLERLELDLPNCNAIKELKEFFELNVQIRSFATNVEFLYKNRSLITASKVKLDDLAIVGQVNDNMHALLDDFHRQGIFKRLHLYNSKANQGYIDRIASLDGLEKLFIGSVTHPSRRLNCMDLTNLKELALYTAHIVCTSDLASGLFNLKRLYIREANAKDITPFIQLSPRLKSIKIPIYDDVVDMVAWNQERNKLFGATKVTIFLPEICYLKHKWANAKKRQQLNMVEIRRAESYNWLHHFFYK